MTAQQPAIDPVPMYTRQAVAGSAAHTLAATAPWIIALVVAGIACLVAQTGAEWLSGALIVAWFVVLDRGLGIPSRAWVPAVVQWLLPVSVLAAAAGLLARRARSGDWISGTVVVEGAVLLALLVIAAWSRAAVRGIPVAPVLSFPLPPGRWFAIEGEGRALNHHWRAPAQRCALDLVRLGGNGMSHRGLAAGTTGAFFAFGSPIHSPCNGTILACRDGYQDHRTPGAHPAGNHVVIEVAGISIVMGHFARGTLLVVTGQQVHTGQQLARVGNSGNSSEPHLHIHAEQDGQPLRLRFAGRRRRSPRGATIRLPG